MFPSTHVPDRVEKQEDKNRPAILVLRFDLGLWLEFISDAESICLSKAHPASPLYNLDFPTDTSRHRLTSNSYIRYLNGEQR